MTIWGSLISVRKMRWRCGDLTRWHYLHVTPDELPAVLKDGYELNEQAPTQSGDLPGGPAERERACADARTKGKAQD